MDIFKFNNPFNDTKMEQGELINDIKTKLWIERYLDFSDFELVANFESGLHTKLPVGSLISHTNSTEIMIVENHEINKNVEEETTIKITGRSFESFFENRIVGSNKTWPTTASAPEEYVLATAFTWLQAVKLIQDHIDPTMVLNPEDGLQFIEVLTDVVDVGEYTERTVKRGSLYTRLIELLNIDNLGIKVIRPGIRSPLGLDNENTAVVIHAGTDLSQEIAFSYTTGEIQSADYLWSNKKIKNSILVTGRWLEVLVKDTSFGYSRRMMFLEASDLDNSYSTAPTGTDRSTILAYMVSRGLNALASQKEIALVKVQPTRSSTVYKYREDYEVGDIITVEGSYNDSTTMRISEYVEIEDETGESGYPTLSIV